MRCHCLAGDHQLCAVTCAAQSDLAPDAATGTGDENRFAAQVTHCQNSVSRFSRRMGSPARMPTPKMPTINNRHLNVVNL